MTPMTDPSEAEIDVRDEAEDDAVLPFSRVPILDRQRTLFAYELQPRDEAGKACEITTQIILDVFANSNIKRLVGSARALVRCNREFLLRHADVLPSGGNLGIIVGQDVEFDEDSVAALEEVAGRGVLLMMDGLVQRSGVTPEVATRIAALMRKVRYVSLDVRSAHTNTESVADAIKRLHALGILVLATHVDDPTAYRLCERLQFDGYQGGHLFRPEALDVSKIKANKLNVLRLMAALQNPDNGPIELEKLIRNDAVLSYKLLNCVNSAYFNLPRKLKSLQHAAIFFGVARIRNWVYAMSLGGLDDNPPELLKFALTRARMCELLGRGLARDMQENAFLTGLFSLLDTMMNAPMEFVLEQVPVTEEVRAALVEDSGPLAPLLGQVRAWETGYVVTIRSGSGKVVDLADTYLHAAEWADEVYHFAGGSETAAA